MITKTERIRPEKVVEAYKKTGYVPGFGIYYGRRSQLGCACGMGVFYVNEKGMTKNEVTKTYLRETHRGLKQDFYNECNEFMNQHFGYSYKEGFARGFDGLEKTVLMSQREVEGYEDGLKTRVLCIKEGLIKEN